MEAHKIVKTTQTQAVAAWINWLNQIRLDKLLEKLLTQDMNLEQAQAVIEKTKIAIRAIIDSNRGGGKGIHGFLAEAAEAGIENAKQLIQGLKPACEWVNNNGPADLCRNGVEIQQKFVKEFFSLTKNGGVLEHLSDYSDFLVKGGKYQIPKDFYDKIMKLLAMPQEEAAKLVTNSPEGQAGFTYANWKKIQEIFKSGILKPEDLEPSVFDYNDVQKSVIEQSLKKEENKILETDRQRREAAYKESRPTIKQGTQATAVSAALEGGMAFCLGVAQKRKQGKGLTEFTKDDWKDVGLDTAKGSAQGGIRGAAIYGMTNFTATPAAVANSFVTASFGVVAQGIKLRRGEITAEEFIVNSEVLCLDVSISAVSALLGQTIIPIPILGAIIGNMAGMFMYQIVKDNFSEREQILVRHYQESFTALNKVLEERYQELIKKLKKELEKFSSMLELAFDLDVNVAFDGSIALADYVGVPKEKVLRNKQDIDNYFLN